MYDDAFLQLIPPFAPGAVHASAHKNNKEACRKIVLYSLIDEKVSDVFIPSFLLPKT